LGIRFSRLGLKKLKNLTLSSLERATVWLRKLRGFRPKNLCNIVKEKQKVEEQRFTIARKSAARNAPRSTASLKS